MVCDRYLTLLGLAVVCLAGCAATAPQDGTQAAAAAPATVETLGIVLSWEVALEEAPSRLAREFLDLEGRPEELLPTLNRFMDDAAVVIAEQLPSSPAVRWVLLKDNPRLKPDHTLHLKLLRFEAQPASTTEPLYSPRIELRAFLSPVGSAQHRMAALTVTSTRIAKGLGEKRSLDLTAFHGEIAAALRHELEAIQRRSR